MVIKYTKIFHTRPSKIYPNWDFWFENKPSGNPDQQLQRCGTYIVVNAATERLAPGFRTKCLNFVQVLARYRLTPEAKSKGLFGAKPLVVFTSEESHYSIVKGANW
jgi:hypothetical protein